MTTSEQNTLPLLKADFFNDFRQPLPAFHLIAKHAKAVVTEKKSWLQYHIHLQHSLFLPLKKKS